MNWTSLIALLPFATVMSITPGPNNLMCAASGVNFGFRRTVPHMLGVALGFPAMLVGVGFGLEALIKSNPLLGDLLKYGGCLYLLFLAYKLATAAKPEADGAAAQPVSFLQAVLFQWVNPKAWVMAVSSMSIFAGVSADHSAQVMVMSVILGLLGLVAVIIWTSFGTMIARKLDSPRALQTFNLVMAGSLIASLVPVFLH